MPQPANHVPHYSSPETADAAGISTDTLKNWVSRKPQVILMMTEEREKVGRGNPILFSFQRVVQVALTARLVALGWQPRPATMAAVTFTDMGHGPSGWQGGPQGGPQRSGRDPGELFAEGETLLIAANPDDAVSTAVVIEADAEMQWHTLFSQLGMARKPTGIVVINVSDVVATVRASLAKALANR